MREKMTGRIRQKSLPCFVQRYHRYWQALIICCFLLGSASSSYSQSPFPNSMVLPWEPQFLSSSISAENLQVCTDHLSVARAAFRRSDWDLILDWSAGEGSLKPLPSRAFEDAKGKSENIQIFDLDASLEGAATSSLVRIGTTDQYDRQSEAYFFTADTRAFETYVSDLPAAERPHLQFGPLIESGVVKRSATTALGIREILNSSGRNYLASQPRPGDNNRTNLYELFDDGSVSRICQVSMYPESHHELTKEAAKRASELAKANRLRVSPAVVMLPEFAKFYVLLSDVLGSAGDHGGGSMCVWCYREGYIRETSYTVMMRPWVSLPEEPVGRPWLFTHSYEDTLAFLKVWSLRGPWEKRRANSLSKQIPVAEQEFESYYQNAFGYTPEEASFKAKVAVSSIVRTFFSGATTFNNFVAKKSSVDVILAFNKSEDAKRASKICKTGQLKVLLIADVAMNEFEPLMLSLKSEKESSDPLPSYKCPGTQVFDPTLSYALHRPYDLGQLIDWGADPNEQNAFGKTPLMHAAHLDYLEAARILISRGADVNAVTHNIRTPYSTTSYAITYKLRTALMYAAENGSLGMIELLLSNDANATATDSEGRSVLDYLSRNVSLDAEQMEAARVLLEDAGATP